MPVAVKCDGCVDRLRRGEEPACAEVCKVDALVFGDLNELVSAGSLREAGAVLAAAGAAATPLPGGDPLAGWRAWGAAQRAAGDASAARVRDDGRAGGRRPRGDEQGGRS